MQIYVNIFSGISTFIEYTSEQASTNNAVTCDRSINNICAACWNLVKLLIKIMNTINKSFPSA